MILFNTLTVKKAVSFTEAELDKENTKTLRSLREWCGKQMDKMSKVIEHCDLPETKQKLIEQRKQLNDVRIKIDRVNGVSSEKIESRNTRVVGQW